MEPFSEELIKILIERHVVNIIDLVCFCWHFTEKTDSFSDLGSLVSPDTESIHVNDSPFVTRGHKSQVDCVRACIAFSYASCTQTFKNRTTVQKYT